MKTITYVELVKKFESLPEGATIIIDGSEHRVLTNIHDDCVFLVKSDDESKSFHIFYDEIDPKTDDFTIVGN